MLRALHAGVSAFLLLLHCVNNERHITEAKMMNSGFFMFLILFVLFLLCLSFLYQLLSAAFADPVRVLFASIAVL